MLYGSQFFGGPVKYVLSGSGHIAGVVNPPAARQVPVLDQRQHQGRQARRLDQGRHGAQGIVVAGLAQWLESIDAEEVPARAVGSEAMPPIEDAPGSYVRVRA